MWEQVLHLGLHHLLLTLGVEDLDDVQTGARAQRADDVIPLLAPCTASAIRVGISCGLIQPQSPLPGPWGPLLSAMASLRKSAPFSAARMRSILALAALELLGILGCQAGQPGCDRRGTRCC